MFFALKTKQIVVILKNQYTENKGKQNFKQYFDAMYDLEAFANRKLLDPYTSYDLHDSSNQENNRSSTKKNKKIKKLL